MREKNKADGHEFRCGRWIWAEVRGELSHDRTVFTDWHGPLLLLDMLDNIQYEHEVRTTRCFLGPTLKSSASVDAAGSSVQRSGGTVSKCC